MNIPIGKINETPKGGTTPRNEKITPRKHSSSINFAKITLGLRNSVITTTRKNSLGKRSLAPRNSLLYKQVLLEQQFQLPENFEMKILCLEHDLKNDKLTGEQVIELINLYSVYI